MNNEPERTRPWILPCPLCGCEYISPINRNPIIKTDTYGNFCEYCGLISFGFETQEKADFIWNMRADNYKE